MKNKIKLLLLFLFCATGITYSQNIVALENNKIGVDVVNTYFQDINGKLNQYIGTWEYSTDTRYFKIEFYKVEMVHTPITNTWYDLLRSHIQYKEKQNGNWITVYNTFPTGPVLADPSFVYNGIESLWPNNDNSVYLDYNEPTESCIRLHSARIYAKYRVENGTPKMEWKREPETSNAFAKDDLCPDGQPMDMTPFKIPEHMELVKIN